MSNAVGFWKLAETEPERMAVVDSDGREVTYGELGTAGNQLVHGLRDLGVPPGGGIAVVMPNSFEVLALYFAAPGPPNRCSS